MFIYLIKYTKPYMSKNPLEYVKKKMQTLNKYKGLPTCVYDKPDEINKCEYIKNEININITNRKDTDFNKKFANTNLNIKNNENLKSNTESSENNLNFENNKKNDVNNDKSINNSFNIKKNNHGNTGKNAYKNFDIKNNRNFHSNNEFIKNNKDFKQINISNNFYKFKNNLNISKSNESFNTNEHSNIYNFFSDNYDGRININSIVKTNNDFYNFSNIKILNNESQSLLCIAIHNEETVLRLKENYLIMNNINNINIIKKEISGIIIDKLNISNEKCFNKLNTTTKKINNDSLSSFKNNSKIINEENYKEKILNPYVNLNKFKDKKMYNIKKTKKESLDNKKMFSLTDLIQTWNYRREK